MSSRKEDKKREKKTNKEETRTAPVQQEGSLSRGRFRSKMTF
jgi:hypothetical protein